MAGAGQEDGAGLGRERVVGVACALLTLAVWSGFILLTRLGVRTSLAPLDLMALRLGVAGLAMLPVFLRFGFDGLAPARALLLAILAGPGVALPAFLGFAGAPAAHGAALMPGTLPLWTAGLAALALGERLDARRVAGICLTLGGVAVIAIPDFLASGGAVPHDMLFPVASLNWALYTVLSRRWGLDPLRAAAFVFVLAAAICIPAYLWYQGPRVLEVPVADLVVQGIYQGLVATIVSLLLFMRAVQALGAGATTLVTAAVPGVVTLAAIPLLGEIPSTLAVAGVGLVTSGVVATVLGSLSRQPSPGR